MYQILGYNNLKMTLLFVIFAIITFALLVLLAAAPSLGSVYSESELKRRSKAGDSTARAALKRLYLSGSFESMTLIVRFLLSIITSLFLVGAFGWVWGIVSSFIVVLLHIFVSGRPVVRRLSGRLFERYEDAILKLVARMKTFLDGIATAGEAYDKRVVHSREELIELLGRSGQAVTPSERQMLVSVLGFGDATVKDVMTPRAAINSINKDEFLGPLVLSELHSLGTSRLPVTDGDIDHIVGVLHLRGMLSLDNKKSTTAEKAMDPTVHYVGENAALGGVMNSFLKTRHHLFIVINESRETVGLITLEDVIERLIGRPIVDEDDVSEDMRQVAVERGKGNNSHAGAVNL